MKEIKRLCEQHNVKSLYAFGSVVTGDFTKDSDVDLIVSFSNVELRKHADNYFDLKFSFEDLFKRKVDLLEEQALKNPYFIQNVNQHKELIYGY
ncbi:MAG: nucleotidyltransferase domain-containing protein [Bacteroidota bacterium]